jgi:hypothetical protein
MDPSTSYIFISSCSTGIVAGLVCLSRSMFAAAVSKEDTQKRKTMLTSSGKKISIESRK